MFSWTLITAGVPLHGLRVSSEIFQCMIWYAERTNATKYQDKFHLLDAEFKLDTSYTVPTFDIASEETLESVINEGRIALNCRHWDNSSTSAANWNVAFKLAFENVKLLSGMHVNRGNISSFYLSTDHLDMAEMRLSPVEPKLPVPSELLQQLAKRVLIKLRPLLNEYLKSVAVNLPPNVVMGLAKPQIKFWKAREGFAENEIDFVEIISFCDCESENPSERCQNTCPKNTGDSMTDERNGEQKEEVPQRGMFEVSANTVLYEMQN